MVETALDTERLTIWIRRQKLGYKCSQIIGLISLLMTMCGGMRL